MGVCAFMVLLANFLVEVSLWMTRKGSSGGRKFSDGHAWHARGKDKAEKGPRKRTGWDEGVFFNIPYAKCNLSLNSQLTRSWPALSARC